MRFDPAGGLPDKGAMELKGMTTKQQRIERTNTLLKFLGIVSQKNLPLTQAQVSNDLDWLHRQETTLHRLAEDACNYGLSPSQEKKEARIENKVTDLLSLYGITVKFNGDPRGGAIRMLLPDHSSNGWDGETWGIYW